MLVLGTGIVLMYDPQFNYIYLLSRQGALQHYFKVSLLQEEKLDNIFDNCDVMTAYCAIVPNGEIINLSKYDKLMTELLTSPKELKHHNCKCHNVIIRAEWFKDELFEPYYSDNDDDDIEEFADYGYVPLKDEFMFCMINIPEDEQDE